MGILYLLKGVVMQKPKKKLPITIRRTVDIVNESLVKKSHLKEGQTLPLMLEPAIDGVNLIEWAGNNLAFLNKQIQRHGGLLFRGFTVSTVLEFEQFITTVSDGAVPYQERSSPRSLVSGKIYTSTDHPANQPIFLHNEQSYNLTFPKKIFFFCDTPPGSGGATPIADTRKIYQQLKPKLRRKFEALGYMLVRNYGEGFGLSWQDAFQTTDKGAVEAYCTENKIKFEWKEKEGLRTKQIRQMVARHPETGEWLWFNHATFFHVSSLVPHVQAMMLKAFAEVNLPHNTYYGDGSPIEAEVLETLRSLYSHETITFPWQKGDLLMLDNMMIAHGREPFTGPRKIVVGMADPVHWRDVQRNDES
jgi:alpha-ketoglutarate-dependent taurine dioxygenase